MKFTGHIFVVVMYIFVVVLQQRMRQHWLFEGVILSCSKFRLGCYLLVFLGKQEKVTLKRCSNVSFVQVSRGYNSEAIDAIIDNNYIGRIKARVDVRKRALHHT